jgi:hypothetical protein
LFEAAQALLPDLTRRALELREDKGAFVALAVALERAVLPRRDLCITGRDPERPIDAPRITVPRELYESLYPTFLIQEEAVRYQMPGSRPSVWKRLIVARVELIEPFRDEHQSATNAPAPPSSPNLDQLERIPQYERIQQWYCHWIADHSKASDEQVSVAARAKFPEVDFTRDLIRKLRAPPGGGPRRRGRKPGKSEREIGGT